MPKRDPGQPMGGKDYDFAIWLGGIAAVLVISALILLT